jgi:hypothetical protein
MHNPKREMVLALAVALAVRALPLAFGYEYYGDSPVRIEAAERWAAHPHLWRGFSEAFQYGPLHLSLIGWLIELLGNRVVAARALSLVCGLLGVWLLGLLTLRHRDAASARWAMFGLALSPLHIQASTTGASEAVFLAMFLGALVLLESEQVALAALLIGAAGLVRYDGWLYVPLFTGYLWWRQRDHLRAAGFAVLAAAPALGWMAVNKRYTGDALAPVHYITRDHLALARMMFDYFGSTRWRLYGLTYWPFAVCGILTPALGIAAMTGAFRTLWRRTSGWELSAIAWLPVAYFTFRTSVLGDFRPLARFALITATLSLIFARDVISPRLRAPVIALMILWPLGLAAVSWNQNGGTAEWARPLSPISSVPPGVAQAATWLREHAKPDDIVLVDAVWDYLDIPLVFAAGLPDQQWIRASWTDDFDQRLARRDPTLAVLLYQGKLGDWTKDRFDFRGKTFCMQQRYVFATIYTRCE